MFNANAAEIENKILHITNLVTTTAPNSKVTESENKTLDITSLVTTFYLNTNTKEIGNKIPDISGFIHKINIGFAGFTEWNLGRFRKPRAEPFLFCNGKQKKINWTPNIPLFILYHFSENFFGDNRPQKYLLFQIFFKYFQVATSGARTLKWKFRWLSKESIKPPATSEFRHVLKLTFTDNAKIQVKLK